MSHVTVCYLLLQPHHSQTFHFFVWFLRELKKRKRKGFSTLSLRFFFVFYYFSIQLEIKKKKNNTTLNWSQLPNILQVTFLSFSNWTWQWWVCLIVCAYVTCIVKGFINFPSILFCFVYCCLLSRRLRLRRYLLYVAKMAESTKLRLVRCPKCENLLPELEDYSVYQCGGCGAVLRG